MIMLPQTVKPRATQAADGTWFVWDEPKDGLARIGSGSTMREAWGRWYRGAYGRTTPRLNSERRGYA